MGGPQYWIHRSATHFATVSAVLSRTHHVTENIFGATLNRKKIHTECFVETERCWKPGFWRMSFSCTCQALELSSHVVEDLWLGTTETKSPQEFLLARVPTIVKDILNYLPLARCQRFLGACCNHLRRRLASRLSPVHQHQRLLDQAHVVLSPQDKRWPRSDLPDLTGIVSFDVSLASGL